MKLSYIIGLIICILPTAVVAQFAPPAGQPGTTAIYKDSSVLVDWASHCEVFRGWQNIADTMLGKADTGDSTMACGQAGTNGVVSLGDGGYAIMSFSHPIINGPLWDFAVFENSFSDSFLELAFVEVSSDGINYFRFPSTSLTDTTIQISAFGELDATKINNLAGKYRVNYGTPFDLQELDGNIGLNINHITHLKIIDVVGSISEEYKTYDSFSHIINDPWPTPFNSSGFDLDAVGVIHQNLNSFSDDESDIALQLFPNPCTSYITIITDNPLQLTILDVNGRELKVFETAGMTSSIDISFLPPGLYFLRASGNKGIAYHKIIKK